MLRNLLNACLPPTSPSLFLDVSLPTSWLDSQVIRDMARVLLHFPPQQERGCRHRGHLQLHPRALLCPAAPRHPVQGRQSFQSQPSIHIYPKSRRLVIFKVPCERQVERKTFRKEPSTTHPTAVLGLDAGRAPSSCWIQG